MATTGQFMLPNTNESGMYCPLCRDTRGVKDVKLERDSLARYQFKCQFGHQIPYASLQQMKPDMVPFVTKEQPNPTLDVKADIWLRKEIWLKFSAKYAGRIQATLNSVLATMVDDDFLFLTGDVVRKLNKANVKKQEDMMALVEENNRLIAESEQISQDNQRLTSLFANAAKSLGSSEGVEQ